MGAPDAAHKPVRAPSVCLPENVIPSAGARAPACLTTGRLLLAFVFCHPLSHISLIISVPVTADVLEVLMQFWWTQSGTYLLAAALAIHVLNALWSIYIRRYLRLPLRELAQ